MADPADRAYPRSRRRTVLLALLALLLAALAAETVLALTRPEPTATAEHPVVLTPVAADAAVRVAAGSTAEILSYGFEDLEAQLEDDASRMTPELAADFRRRVLAGRDSLVAQRATQEAEVLAAGVVTATPSQVEALVLLDRRVAEAGEGTTVRPYRVLVTVVRRGGVWLVSDIETR